MQGHWEALESLVWDYPITATVESLPILADLEEWGYAVDTGIGEFIPTAQGIVQFYKGPWTLLDD